MPHQYSCSQCSFEVQSDDQTEIVDTVQRHAEDKHDMDVSEDDVRSGMENA